MSMLIHFLHGWQSTPGGLKPTYLKDHGHTVLNPALPDDDFDQAVRIAQAEFDRHKPDVVVGSSRGGAVAMNISSGDTPLVLLCPAWKRFGTANTVKPGTIILHSPADDVVPFADSQDLLRNSGLPESTLIAVGTEHRLADEESLKRMLEVVERTSSAKKLVDVVVYYLEMRAHSHRSVAAPRDGLTILHARNPSVPYYRFLVCLKGRISHCNELSLNVKGKNNHEQCPRTDTDGGSHDDSLPASFKIASRISATTERWSDSNRFTTATKWGLHKEADKPMTDTIFTPGPTPNSVRSADGNVLTAPDGWLLLQPGDAALTRRLKAAGVSAPTSSPGGERTMAE